MARLKDMYQMGDIEKPEYLKRREALQRQIAQATPVPSRTLDLDRAMEMLSSMGELLDAATPAQQRALQQQVLTTIWIEKGAVTAIRPAPIYALLVKGMARMWSKRSRLGSNQRLKLGPPV